MKALKTRIVRDGDKYYRLKAGEEVPAELSGILTKTLATAGIIERPAAAPKPSVDKVKEVKKEDDNSSAS